MLKLKKIAYTSLTDLFLSRARNSPVRVVHRNEEDRVAVHSLGGLYELSLKVACFLRAQGVSRGHAVAIMASNRPEWLAVYMGIIHAGACALPIDIHLTALEVRNLIADSGAKVFFIERSLLAQVRSRELDESVRRFVVLDAEINYLSKCVPFSWIEDGDSQGFEPEKSGGDETASLIYTSGTTGRPKAVALSHANLLSQLVIARTMRLNAESRVLMVLPLNHAYAFSSCFLIPLEAGSEIHILNSLKRTDLVQFIREEKITTMAFVPAILSQFHRGILERIDTAPHYAQFLFHALKSLDFISANGARFNFLKRRIFKKVHEFFGGGVRCIISGAAGLDEEIARTFNTLGLPVFEGYGLTETSPVVALNHPSSNKPGTVGRPLKGVEIKIVDPKGDGVGEIAVKGRPVFKGYRGKGAENAAPFDKEGYFLTGDLGSMDRNGFLTISGRSKDVIVLPSGKNVFPSEIEDFYLQAECLKEVAVLGIPREVGKKAEEIYAFVVPNPDFFREHGISDVERFVKNAIIEMSDRLPGWCRINRYTIRHEPLPKTATNKVKKFLLRDEILDQMGKRETRDVEVKAEALLNRAVGKILGTAIKKVKGARMNYTLASHLFLDLGFDSLSVSELIVTLETLLGAEIPRDMAYQMRTIGDCVTVLGEFCAQNRIDVDALTETLPISSEPEKTSWIEVLNTKVPENVARETEMRIRRRGRFSGAMRRLAISFSSIVARLLFRYEVTGLNHLPKDGPFILAADHFNYIDALFVMWALPAPLRQKLFCIGKKEHLHHLHRTFFAWLAGMIPVDRTGNFVPSLQTGKKVIDRGQVLLIFPEGTRSKDACINEFKNGVGILSEATGAPVVPVHLDGTYEITRPERRRPKFCKVKIHVGQPVTPFQVANGEAADKHEAITQAVKQRIIALGARSREERRSGLAEIKYGGSDDRLSAQ